MYDCICFAKHREIGMGCKTAEGTDSHTTKSKVKAPHGGYLHRKPNKDTELMVSEPLWHNTKCVASYLSLSVFHSGTDV